MRIRLAAVLWLSGAVALTAQERRPLSAFDLYRLRTAANVALSPDGRWAVYRVTEIDSAANRYRSDLWVVATDGRTPPRRLTWRGDVGAVAVSPDGGRIAFVAPRGGRPQIWILPWREGGEAWPLTDLPSGAGDPVWSPDGRRLAFVASLPPRELSPDSARADSGRVDPAALRRLDRDRAAALASLRAWLRQNARQNDPRVVTRLDYLGETSLQEERYAQVYVVDVVPGARPRALTRFLFSVRSPTWTPDGRRILAVAQRPRGSYHPDFETETQFVWLDPEGARPAEFVADSGYAISNPRVSADGRWLVYVRQRRNVTMPTAVRRDLVARPLAGGPVRELTAALDRSVQDFVLHPSGWVYVTLASEGAVPLYRVRISGGRPEPVRSGPRGVLSVAVAGSTVAWVEMEPKRPSDVWAAALDGRRPRRLTALNDAWLADVWLADYEELRYRSFDGTPIQGWVLRPRQPRGGRAPLLVEIHGGPHSMWGPGEPTMWLEFQTFAGAGYTVFFCNPRGSEGYGEAFLRAIYRNWGTPPARDVLAGADTVLARGWADPQQQVITGGSYAGFLTTWIVAREAPTRFRAAVAARGVYDLGTWYGSSNTWRLFEGEFGTRPWEDWAIVRQQSPLTYVADLRTPLLLLHGEQDYRTTIAGAEALYRALKVLGRPVEFVRYPREGHELTRSGEPRHRIDHLLRTLEFFERYLPAP